MSEKLKPDELENHMSDSQNKDPIELRALNTGEDPQITKIANNHPLDNVSWLSKLLMNWVNQPLELQKKKGLWTQETHYDLPEYDLIAFNANKLFKNLKKSKNRSIFSAIIQTYQKDIISQMLIILSYTLLNFSTAFLTSDFIHKITYSGGKVEGNDKWVMPLMFSGIMVALFLSSVLQNYSLFELNRISYLTRSTVNFLIF
jgi:hypothetical protein